MNNGYEQNNGYGQYNGYEQNNGYEQVDGLGQNIFRQYNEQINNTGQEPSQNIFKKFK